MTSLTFLKYLLLFLFLHFIAEPLRVNLSPQELQLDVGKTALFNCSVEGHPIGSVVWKKDARFIASNSRVQFPTPTSLQLRQLKRQDSGMYQCFAHRDSVSSQAAARLIIGGKQTNSLVMSPNKWASFYYPDRISWLEKKVTGVFTFLPLIGYCS